MERPAAAVERSAAPVERSVAPVERSAVGREPDGGERGGTLPIFKEKKSLEREEAKGWEE